MIEKGICDCRNILTGTSQNELVGKIKMAAGDLVSIRGQFMEYTYIPTGIKRGMVRSEVDCHWKG